MKKYLCPICDNEMTIIKGDRLDAKNGFTLICYNKECPSSENVEGHGSNEEKAYQIAKEKFKFYAVQDEK